MIIGLMFIGAFILIGVFLLVFVIGGYNALVTLRNRYKNAYSQIDVQLKRRYDLIPNLVETAKGYLAHERQTLEAVMRARAAAVSASQRAAENPASPDAVRTLAAEDAGLAGALRQLMVVAEAYPDLKANQTMMQLSEELTSTENKVSFARQAYNDAVMTYNNAREVFPSSIVAGMFGFQPAQPLDIAKPEAREAPKVSFT